MLRAKVNDTEECDETGAALEVCARSHNANRWCHEKQINAGEIHRLCYE